MVKSEQRRRPLFLHPSYLTLIIRPATFHFSSAPLSLSLSAALPPQLDTYLKGFHGDNCATVGVGTIDAAGQRLMDATEVGLHEREDYHYRRGAPCFPFRDFVRPPCVLVASRHVANGFVCPSGVFVGGPSTKDEESGVHRTERKGRGGGELDGEASAAAKPEQGLVLMNEVSIYSVLVV